MHKAAAALRKAAEEQPQPTAMLRSHRGALKSPTASSAPSPSPRVSPTPTPWKKHHPVPHGRSAFAKVQATVAHDERGLTTESPATTATQALDGARLRKRKLEKLDNVPQRRLARSLQHQRQPPPFEPIPFTSDIAVTHNWDELAEFMGSGLMFMDVASEPFCCWEHLHLEPAKLCN